MVKKIFLDWFRDFKISTKLLILFLVPIFLVAVFFYWSINDSYSRYLDEILDIEISNTENNFFVLTQYDIKTLSSVLENITNDPAIKKAYLQEDADVLNENALPLFDKLKSGHGITHWYFISPDDQIILGVNERDVSGDKIIHSALQLAHSSNKIASGIELDKTSYVLRVVIPYYDEDKLIGYVELNKEVDNFLESVRGVTGNNLFLAVNKKYLDRADWQSMNEKSGFEGSWDNGGEYVIVSGAGSKSDTLCISDERVALIEKGKIIPRLVSGNFGCGGFAINSPTGDQIGAVLTHVNMSDHISNIDSIMRVNMVVMSILLVILIVVGFLFSKLISRPISNLLRVVQLITIGDITQRATVKSKDELGRLASSFNSMVDEINHSRNMVEQEVERQTHEINKQREQMEKYQKAMLNILGDVNEEKRNLSHEKDKISIILESIGDGVFVVDNQLRIIIFNKMAEKISGFSFEELSGKEFFRDLKFVYEDNMRLNDQFIRDAISSGKIGHMNEKTALIRKDGQKIPVADSAAPLKDANGNILGCVVVFRDVREERAVDKAKSELISLASHQLRTPLTAINWYTEMLISEENLTKSQKDYLNEIYLSSNRMVNLVSALLNVSRIEMGTFAISPEPVDIVKVSKSVLKEFKIQIREKKLKIKEKYENIDKINLDPNLINIIFQNLISNSIKYTPENGTIGVNISKDKQYLLIEVYDTGYGIPKNQQMNIFSKLFRADNVREKETDGTGLGLYIIKSIVDSSGGKIWFDSKEDEGTIFHINIPIKGMKKKKGAKDLSSEGLV